MSTAGFKKIWISAPPFSNSTSVQRQVCVSTVNLYSSVQLCTQKVHCPWVGVSGLYDEIEIETVDLDVVGCHKSKSVDR